MGEPLLLRSQPFLPPLAQRASEREWLDEPISDRAVLAANLADIRRYNRYLGWVAAMARTVERFAQRRGLRDYTLLDVATGSADLPVALARRAARRGRPVRVLGSDLSAEVLACARGHIARERAAVQLLRHDALRPPFAPGSVDLVTCALSLHHFDPDVAVRLLRSLAATARHGFIVGDLERGRLAYLGARLSLLLTRNPYTRHDAPLSVRRAYTRAELRTLVAEARLMDYRVTVRRAFPFRLTISGERIA